MIAYVTITLLFNMLAKPLKAAQSAFSLGSIMAHQHNAMRMPFTGRPIVARFQLSLKTQNRAQWLAACGPANHCALF